MSSIVDPFKQLLFPFARAVRLKLRYQRARREGQRPPRPASPTPISTSSFIVGCGRSGTTILGHIFMSHPQITYLFEPIHLWAAIDPRTDVAGLHVVTPHAKFFLNGEDWTEDSQIRFNRLVLARARPGTRIVEKTPHNIARIGWIEALSPGARYVHIVRNGLSVAKSIGGLATLSPYKIFLKPTFNQWWGTNSCKWHTLSTEGAARNYFPHEIDLLQSHAQRGAYEWLISLGEADRWRERLGNRFFELTYTQLTTQPEDTLKALCQHLGLEVPETWVQKAKSQITPERLPGEFHLTLPSSMRQTFNQYQERYAFPGKAGIDSYV